MWYPSTTVTIQELQADGKWKKVKTFKAQIVGHPSWSPPATITTDKKKFKAYASFNLVSPNYRLTFIKGKNKVYVHAVAFLSFGMISYDCYATPAGG